LHFYKTKKLYFTFKQESQALAYTIEPFGKYNNCVTQASLTYLWHLNTPGKDVSTHILGSEVGHFDDVLDDVDDKPDCALLLLLK